MEQSAEEILSVEETNEEAPEEETSAPVDEA